MKRLIIATLVISLAAAAVIIDKERGKNTHQLAGGDRSAQVLSSETTAPHTDQEIIDAPCPREDGSQWSIGKPISCEKSPDTMYLAKFFYNGMATPERYYELFVIHMADRTIRRIWAGDFHTLGWDWRGNEKIEIRYNCGTGCQAIKTMGLNESASIADYKNGRMSEKNGWQITFTKSF
ncbi:hypothetical protein HY949_04505 [Candidatus Gottesmanbacteria bacterium]|nr:hypothetical protein [Candidatus Gottesmanbacteria bacterium]